MGRARDQRPALLLPADPPGHEADPLRLHRLRPLAQPAGRAPRPADGQRVRPDRGARLRQDRRRGARRGHARRSSSRIASSRATGPRTRSSPSGSRRAPSAPWWRSTSTASSPRARSGTSTPSTSGAWSSARSWPSGSSPSSRPTRSRARPRQLHQRPDPPLPGPGSLIQRGAATTVSQRDRGTWSPVDPIGGHSSARAASTSARRIPDRGRRRQVEGAGRGAPADANDRRPRGSDRADGGGAAGCGAGGGGRGRESWPESGWAPGDRERTHRNHLRRGTCPAGRVKFKLGRLARREARGAGSGRRRVQVAF